MRRVDAAPRLRRPAVRPHREAAVVLLHRAQAANAGGDEHRGVAVAEGLGVELLRNVAEVDEREDAGRRLFDAAVWIAQQVTELAAEPHQRQRADGQRPLDGAGDELLQRVVAQRR